MKNKILTLTIILSSLFLGSTQTSAAGIIGDVTGYCDNPTQYTTNVPSGGGMHYLDLTINYCPTAQVDMTGHYNASLPLGYYIAQHYGKIIVAVRGDQIRPIRVKVTAKNGPSEILTFAQDSVSSQVVTSFESTTDNHEFLFELVDDVYDFDNRDTCYSRTDEPNCNESGYCTDPKISAGWTIHDLYQGFYTHDWEPASINRVDDMNDYVAGMTTYQGGIIDYEARLSWGDTDMCAGVLGSQYNDDNGIHDYRDFNDVYMQLGIVSDPIDFPTDLPTPTPIPTELPRTNQNNNTPLALTGGIMVFLGLSLIFYLKKNNLYDISKFKITIS
jgi:LPXTG-motif cell wall-anchored protein